MKEKNLGVDEVKGVGRGVLRDEIYSPLGVRLLPRSGLFLVQERGKKEMVGLVGTSGTLAEKKTQGFRKMNHQKNEYFKSTKIIRK